MLVHHDLEVTAARAPESLALVTDDERLTWRELDRRASALAATLQSRGLERGDRVALLLPNVAEMAIAAYATLKAGGVFMPLGAHLKASKLAYVLNDAEPSVLVAEARLRAPVWDAPAAATPSVRTIVEVGPEKGPRDARLVPWSEAVSGGAQCAPCGAIDQDLAAIIYTSGTTGEPKGVMLSHLNMRSATRSVHAYLGYRPDDVVYCALPLSFGYGLYQILLAAHAGARVVLASSFAYPVQALEVMARERVTIFPAVPTMLASVLRLAPETTAAVDLSRLRTITNAAAALTEAQLRETCARFPQARLYSMYGLTECKRVSYLPPEELARRPLSVGRGMPNQEVCLMDDQGRRLPWGSTGELAIRGSHVMVGYWRKPDETAQKLRTLAGGTWLRTGDLFRTDEEGWLYFVSRKDDMIKTRGEPVSPKEVESAIASLEGVADVAVAGQPDDLLGSAIVAFVVCEPGVEFAERDVVRHCKERLEAHMVPKSVVFVAELPRTPNGKVARRLLTATGPR